MSVKKQGRYRFNEFEVDLAHRSLRRDGHVIAVSSKTLDLLIFLVLHAQRVVSRDELVRALWPQSDADENNLGQHVFLLRQALTGREPGDKIILTLPGRGFRFNAPVLEMPQVEPEVETCERLTPYAVPLASHVSVEPANKQTQQTGQVGRTEQAEAPDVTYFERDSEPGFFSASTNPGSLKIGLLAAIVVVFGILLLGGWFGWRWLHRSRPTALGVVIGDFQNSTGDPQFDLALRTALAADLRQSPYLKVTAAATSTRQTESQMCTSLHDYAYLAGEIHRFSQKYLVTVQAFDCAHGSQLAVSHGIADFPDSVLTVLDKVAADVRKQLGESTQSVDKFNKAAFPAHINSLPAIGSYTEANKLALDGKYTDAIPLYEWAIKLDSQFADAYEELGLTYSRLGDGDLAAANFSKAYELRDTVDEYDRLNIVANFMERVTGDLTGAIRNDKQWSEEYPSDSFPLTSLGSLEIQIGKSALALEAGRHALELNPSNASAYEVLAIAQMHLGQFEEAASTCRQAIGHHAETVQIHAILLQIAFRNLDQPALDEQVAWADKKPEASYMQVQQGLIDFAEGRAKAAEAIFASLAADYRQRGQTDQANSILEGVPRIEAELGLMDAARALLNRLPPSKEGGNDGNLTQGVTDIPVAWAQAGETSRADALLQQGLDAHPSATLWQEYDAPQIRAAIALNQHRPEDAIDALQLAAQYDLRSFDALAMRGRAYLAEGQPALAEAEFHKILDHPGIEPLSHNYPLAQLGLARALVLEDKTVEAGFAYKVVFQIWKDADPDLPRLREAKAEYAKLTAGSVRTVAKSPVKPRRK